MVLANGVDEEMADLAEEARSFFAIVQATSNCR